MADMIVDFNCDAGPYAFREYPVTTAAEVVGESLRLGITAAYVGSTQALTYLSPQPANERLMADLQGVRGVAVRPAAVLNPQYPGALRDLRDCADMGFRALKLYPTYHDFDLTSHETVALVDEAAALGWPVLLCVRVEDERHHHPLMKVPPLAMDQAITFARNVPPATVVLCTGTAAEVPAFLKGVARDNVVAEISYIKSPLSAIEDLVARVGSDRLVFGSHLPFSYAQTALAKVRESSIGEAAVEAILGGNAARIIGG
jgi:predicted TIM-barrel fold metal-dependent hydrolase